MSRALKQAGLIAVVVGPILILINQFDALVAGELSNMLVIKMLLTPVVPFAVSYVSTRSAERAAEQQTETIAAGKF